MSWSCPSILHTRGRNPYVLCLKIMKTAVHELLPHWLIIWTTSRFLLHSRLFQRKLSFIVGVSSQCIDWCKCLIGLTHGSYIPNQSVMHEYHANQIPSWLFPDSFVILPNSSRNIFKHLRTTEKFWHAHVCDTNVIKNNFAKRPKWPDLKKSIQLQDLTYPTSMKTSLKLII